MLQAGFPKHKQAIPPLQLLRHGQKDISNLKHLASGKEVERGLEQGAQQAEDGLLGMARPVKPMKSGELDEHSCPVVV